MKLEIWVIVGGWFERVFGAFLNILFVFVLNFVLGIECFYSCIEVIEIWEVFEDVFGGFEGGHVVLFLFGMVVCSVVLSQLLMGVHFVIFDDCY